MMRQISKILFPDLPRDMQRRRMNMLIVTLLVTLAGGCAVIAAIFLMNRR